ncbi:16S rRNA (uracil(1498)-N(3))-methyltransferase [Thalassolituus sp. ST750PaO-4]|uniref:16S rRNA (uracil(1498)-N(3))-methyltransferase n=1 Tax=Thalassolituus sp. ST750PaO-4 TaxID=2742965 RepID=UPI000C5333A9|nr:16S rRNA (uracil(1498)-N(3))-methyltransferase [Thalassolituus sp. ST750PaO-4]MCA6060577.1 16S rRNA (uracil(1498)-N(3))-methyltransferase [Thalassolituus sp. ST750PaO-4]PIQ40931.1 MAG: 16S rRNA (uracil(1498)-N(3))-methyltransferase [Thalassolituus sp. CG17_big_fil_post_rev_8_21_14_2_50_53_8]
MSGPRIYSAADLSSGLRTELDDQAFAHLIRVLRMNDGDPVRLFNGDGHEYAGQLCDVQKKSASVLVGDILRSEADTPLKLQLGQVVSKGDRMDFTIQKATELGISDITPLWSERCEVRLKGERLDKKMEHWQKVAISACEQSGRNRIPTIHQPQYFADWAKNNNADVRLLLHPHRQKPLRDYPQPASVALLVGPEGGFSEQEVEMAMSSGFAGLTLGPRILRTETAALAALSVFQFQWGDFS